MSARPVTPASPKNVKVKSPIPGSPMFGCEHVQALLSKGQETMNSSIAHYKIILRGIFDSTPIVPQTSTNPEGRPITSLTSNYLCLQCPTTVSEEDRLKHGSKKQHRFCALPPLCPMLGHVLTLEKTSTLAAAPSTVRYAMTWSGTRPWRSCACAR